MNVILLTWCQGALEIFLKNNRKHVSEDGVTVKGRQWGWRAWCPSMTFRGTWTPWGAASQGTNHFAFPNHSHSKPKWSYFNFWLPAQGLLKMHQRYKKGLDAGLEISAMPAMLHSQPQCPHLSWELLWECAELLGGAHHHCEVWLYTIIIFERIDISWTPCSSPLILDAMAVQPRGCWEGRHSGCMCSHDMLWWQGCPPLWRERSKQAPGTVCSAFHVSGGASAGRKPLSSVCSFPMPSLASALN